MGMVKMIASPTLPTKQEIERRLRKHIPATDFNSILKDLMSNVTEEVESILMEIYLRRNIYDCPKCRKMTIESFHNYCPVCGFKIK